MIYAELRGKVGKEEDRFTSTVLGLLSFLPASDFLQFLMKAHTREKKLITIRSGPRSDLRIEFWPYLTQPRVCIPDAIVTVVDSTIDTFRLVLEVKIGAPQTGDQLSDYWKAGSIQYPGGFELIYLTDDRSVPNCELESSERTAGSNVQIYWLNWYSLFLWIQRRLSDRILPAYSEQRILLALESYLIQKGYQTFLPWRRWASGLRASYTRRYVWSAGERLTGRAQYIRTYFSQSVAKTAPLPYTPKHPRILS